jgi:YVTN family beta-propeller protein
MPSPAILRRFVALLVALCVSPAAAAGPFAYIANSGSDDVSVIDTVTNTVVATIPVGDTPYGVGITPDFGRVYVANYGSNSLSVIDTKTNTVSATIPNVCANPTYVESTPNGAEMWVSCHGTTFVYVVSTATNTVTRWSPHQTQPLAIHFNADGSRAYIASWGNATIRVHRTDGLWQIVQAPSGTRPTDFAIEPSGEWAWVLSSGESRISNLNLTTNRLDRTWWFASAPFSIAMHPDSVHLYVTNPNSGKVTLFHTQGTSQTLLDVGGMPMGIDRNADGSRVYVANQGSNTVQVIDTATYTVVATIPVGSAPRSHGRFVAKGFPPPDSVPAAPADVVATAGPAQASVAFTPGNDGGGPIVRYTATCGTQSATGVASPIVVTGLVVGTPVTCTIAATNALGDGAPSAPSNEVTPYAIAPAAPTGIVATAGDQGISVAFAAPHDGFAAITHYTATCTTPDLAQTFSATGQASPIAVPDTPNLHSYTCRVVATNAIGDGAPSAPSSAVTPDAVPAQPIVEALSRGNGLVTVAFTPGTPPRPHSAITGWKVACGSRTASGTESPVVVFGLTNGVPVTCTVVAVNVRGDSAPSEPSAAVTPATVPGAPTVTGITRGNGMVRVTFTPPADNGGTQVTGYIVRCGSQAVFGGNLTLPVSGLPNGVPVTCTVQARNDVGDGVVSAPSDSVTPASAPDAPTISAATGGDGTAQLTFAAPAHDGGAAISGYRASCTPGAHTTSGTSSPLTLTGLTNGETYTCTVLAINEIGDGAASTGMTVVPRRVADLSVSIDNAATFIAGGTVTSYLIDVVNGDTAAVAGVRVRSVLGSGFSDVTWACSAQSGSQCLAAGSGDVDILVDLGGQSSVTFLVTATVAAQPEAPVSATATITAPNNINDPVAANDTSTDGPDAVGVFADGFE